VARLSPIGGVEKSGPVEVGKDKDVVAPGGVAPELRLPLSEGLFPATHQNTKSVLDKENGKSRGGVLAARENTPFTFTVTTLGIYPPPEK